MPNLDISELIITIIEPSVTQSKIIMRNLSELSVTKVQYYPTATLALELIEKFPPDLIMSSMYPSDISAEELILKIRANPTIEQIPFMLVTSESSHEILDTIKQAGAVAILKKPFKLDELEAALYSTADTLSIDEEFLDRFAWENLDVLIVDDSPLSQKVISQLLENIGITKIHYASNGKEGIALINSNFYDFVITDYNMPEMDGKDLVAYIRDSSNQQSVPVLMITSERDEKRLAAAREAGVSDISDKPFDSIAFKELISKYVIDDA